MEFKTGDKIITRSKWVSAYRIGYLQRKLERNEWMITFEHMPGIPSSGGRYENEIRLYSSLTELDKAIYGL